VTRAIGYVRVSTADQAEHGVSLEAQEAKLRGYAALYDITLTAIEFDAGQSASTLERPALKRALAGLRKVDALIVVKLDRLTRSVRDLSDLVDRYFQKKALLSVTEQIDTRTAAGRGVLNILGSVSQMERELIGERTAAALAHKAARGERVSALPPYGWRHEGDRLEPVAAEQATIARARELRMSGLSLRAVAETLGPVARTGRTFDPKTLARVLERPAVEA
jgi:DNA invertase Pin-like site-specific DNA recombinase